MALKRLKNKEGYAEFLNEVRILHFISHPHIVHFFGIYKDETGEHYIVTGTFHCATYNLVEYLCKGSLNKLVQQEKDNLSVTDLLGMAKHAAAGLRYLEQQKIIHRDLALRNLLVTVYGQDAKYLVKVGDFGLARTTERGLYQSTNAFLPIRWCAPEYIEYGYYDSRCDVWSFGIVLWVCCNRWNA